MVQDNNQEGIDFINDPDVETEPDGPVDFRDEQQETEEEQSSTDEGSDSSSSGIDFVNSPDVETETDGPVDFSTGSSSSGDSSGGSSSSSSSSSRSSEPEQEPSDRIEQAEQQQAQLQQAEQTVEQQLGKVQKAEQDQRFEIDRRLASQINNTGPNNTVKAERLEEFLINQEEEIEEAQTQVGDLLTTLERQEQKNIQTIEGERTAIQEKREETLERTLFGGRDPDSIETPQTGEVELFSFENVESIDPRGRIPINSEEGVPNNELVAGAPGEEINRQEFETVGRQLPGTTNIEGVNTFQTEIEQGKREAKSALSVFEPGQAGLKTERTARQAGEPTLGEILLSEEQQEQATGNIQNIRPGAPIASASEQIGTATATSIGLIEGTGAALDLPMKIATEGGDAVDDIVKGVESLDRTIGGSPEETLEGRNLDSSTVRQSTQGDNRGPREIARDAQRAGTLTSVISTGTLGLGGFGVVPTRASTTVTRSTPVKTRSNIPTRDIPEMDQLPGGFTRRVDEPETGIGQRTTESTRRAPGLVEQRFTGEIRGQTRQGTDSLETGQDLTPTERRVLRDRLEVDEAGVKQDRGAIERMIDEFEEVSRDPKGEASLVPRLRKESTDTDELTGLQRATETEELTDIPELTGINRPSGKRTTTGRTTRPNRGVVIAPELREFMEQEDLEFEEVQDTMQDSGPRIDRIEDTGSIQGVEEEIIPEFQTDTQQQSAQTGTAPASNNNNNELTAIFGGEPQRRTLRGRNRRRKKRPRGFFMPTLGANNEEEEEDPVIVEQEARFAPDLESILTGRTAEVDTSQELTGFEVRPIPTGNNNNNKNELGAFF